MTTFVVKRHTNVSVEMEEDELRRLWQEDYSDENLGWDDFLSFIGAEEKDDHS